MTPIHSSVKKIPVPMEVHVLKAMVQLSVVPVARASLEEFAQKGLNFFAHQKKVYPFSLVAVYFMIGVRRNQVRQYLKVVLKYAILF